MNETLRITLNIITDLNDLGKHGIGQVPENIEYARGQIELASYLFGVPFEDIYETLGVAEL